MTRFFLLALLPWLALALAREFEASLGLVLHTSLVAPGVLRAALSAMDTGRLAVGLLSWGCLGAVAFAALVRWRTHRERSSREQAAREAALEVAPLFLVPLTSMVAVLALFFRSSWPFGHTLAVALTQDLAPGRDALVAATLVAAQARAVRFRPPKAGAVFFVAFLVYALLTPEWARHWDNHPGNEPKYLRMAVALSHRLSLDVEPVSASLEELEPLPIGTAAIAAARGLLRESGRMLAAVARGEAGRDAITAHRITRQTIGGKEGGVYHVLAPGPSLLLAPTLRLDRALNRAFATPGRLAVSVLLMNALGALLVMALFQLARDATGRPGLAAVLAFVFALLPPFLFYFFQFYPEMPGALVLAVAFRLMFLGDGLRPRAALGLGLLLAFLPWLHQKFLPVWLVLAAVAVFQAHRLKAGRAQLVRLVAPQLVSLFLLALYNFGIAGSVRPDALFLAWGPAGVTTARIGQGILGLWLDARYGLLPYAPVYLLGLAGVFLASEPALRLRAALPAAIVYYLTVAAADNWAGAVCNLGRYLMPILPLCVAFAAVAISRTASRRGALTLVLFLFGVSGLFAHALWLDPHAANDSALLLAKSRFADGALYIPGLFIRSWDAGAPGLFVRVAVWLALVSGLASWLVRVARGSRGEKPLLTAVATVGLLMALAALLERWPSWRQGPVFPNAVTLGSGLTVFPEGDVQRKGELLEAAPGETRFVVRRIGSAAAPPLPMLVGGSGGLFHVPGRPSVALRPHGMAVELPLQKGATIQGADGSVETLSLGFLYLDGQSPAVLRFPPESPRETEPPVPAER